MKGRRNVLTYRAQVVECECFGHIVDHGLYSDDLKYDVNILLKSLISKNYLKDTRNFFLEITIF